MKRAAFLLILALGWAQEERVLGESLTPSRPSAYLQGRLIDARTGEPLPAVQVRVGAAGTYTDARGTFSLPYEKPDTLTAFLLGYRIIKVFIHKPSAELLLRMEPIESELETVQIIADAERETEAAVFLERIRSLEIGESYSQELIMRRSTDFYVPNVLRRLPGVSLLSGRFISIRGIGERYNAFAFWSAYPAWLSYDASFGEVEQLITTLLGRVEVRKFWTPELLGHFGGGMVDFQLPSAGQSGMQVAFTTEGDLGAVGRPFARYRSPIRSPIPDDFPSPAVIQASENEGRPLAENFAYARQVSRYVAPDTIPFALPGGLLTLSYNLRRDKWALALRGAYSRRFLTGQMRFQDGGFVEEDGIWKFASDIESAQPTRMQLYSEGGGLSWHTAWYPSASHSFTIEGVILANTSQRISMEEGAYINPEIDTLEKVFFWYPSFTLQRSTMTIIRPRWDFRGRHWQGSIQLGGVMQQHTIPQAGAMNYVQYPGTTEKTYELELYGESEIYAQVWTARTRAQQWYVHPFVERRWEVPWGWLQARLGGWASQEIQVSRHRQLGFMPDTAGGAPYVLDPTVYAMENIRQVYDQAYFRPGGWYLIERTGDFHRHRGETQLIAGYSWLRSAWGEHTEALLGLRYESWRRRIHHTPILTETETVAASIQDGYWLPAFILKQRLSSHSSLRFGANMTLIRPPLPTQIPLRYFDYFYAFYWQGDLSIRTGRSYNADLRYEWLRQSDKLLAFGVFYKQLHDLPEVYLIPASYTLTLTYATRLRQWGEVIGMEVESRYPLWEDGRNRLWSYATLTLSESALEQPVWRKLGRLEGRLQGHAPLVGNLGILFSRSRYELTTFLLYTGNQIWAIGFDPYVYPHIIEWRRLIGEVQLSYKLSENWEVRLAIWDFVNQPYRRIQQAENLGGTYNPDRDALLVDERWSYRFYLTIRYRFLSGR